MLKHIRIHNKAFVGESVQYFVSFFFFFFFFLRLYPLRWSAFKKKFHSPLFFFAIFLSLSRV